MVRQPNEVVSLRRSTRCQRQWLARGSRTLVAEFAEMTACMLWWFLMVGVGCWWLCATSRQNGAWITVATQTEQSNISVHVCVSQFGEGHHRDSKCQVRVWSLTTNHSAENHRIVSGSQAELLHKPVGCTLLKINCSTHHDYCSGATSR